MSFVLEQVKSRPPGTAALCLLGVSLGLPSWTRAEADMPGPVRVALEKNAAALNRISLTWERKRSSTLVLPELLKRLHLTEELAFLEPHQVRYTAEDGMFYAFFTDKHRDSEKSLREVHSEQAFDRKNLYVGSGLVDRNQFFPVAVLQVTPLHPLRKKDQPNWHLWNPEYFDAAGFQVPHTVAALLQPPRSLVLALHEQGARVTKFWEERAKEQAPSTVIELATRGRTYRFDLDPALGYAVRRQEERSACGTVAVVTTNTDFVRLSDPEVWLPRRCQAQWYTWHTIPDEFTRTPLVVVDTTLGECDQRPVPRDRFSLDYGRTPGALISDGRLPGADQAPDGVITYLVPIEPSDLDEAVREVLEGGKLDRGRPASSILWWAAIGLGFAAAVSTTGMLTWRRVIGRATQTSSDS